METPKADAADDGTGIAAEPLLPIEKLLIGGSLTLGVLLLGILWLFMNW